MAKRRKQQSKSKAEASAEPSERVVNGFKLQAHLKNKLVFCAESLVDPRYVAVFFAAKKQPQGARKQEIGEYIDRTLQRLRDSAPEYNMRVLSPAEIEKVECYEDLAEKLVNSTNLIIELPPHARMDKRSCDPALAYLGAVAQTFFADELVADKPGAKAIRGFEAFEAIAPKGEINISNLLPNQGKASGKHRS